MTKKAFLYYSLIFISNISIYRLNLNEKIRNEPILLILDGHASHVNFYAAYLLYLFNIDLLLILPHTSHLSSAFDISIASPIKTFFAQELTKFDYIKELLDKKPFLFKLRFLNAHKKASTTSNIKSGFEKAGMILLNPEIPLFSDYSMESTYTNLFKDKANHNLPTFLRNSEHGLLYLFRKEFLREPTSDDFSNAFEKIKNLLTENLDIDSGIPLSKLPDIINEDENGLKRIKIHF